MTSSKTSSSVVKVKIHAPEITQELNRELLRLDRWMTVEVLRNTYWEMDKGNTKPGTRRNRELDELLEMYGKLYEWKNAQEDYDKAEDKETVKRPVVPIEEIYRLRGELGKNIRNAFIHAGFIKDNKSWKDNGV